MRVHGSVQLSFVCPRVSNKFPLVIDNWYISKTKNRLVRATKCKL